MKFMFHCSSTIIKHNYKVRCFSFVGESLEYGLGCDANEQTNQQAADQRNIGDDVFHDSIDYDPSTLTNALALNLKE